MPVPPVIDHYRETYEIRCPALHGAPGDYQLVTINPFLAQGSGYIVLVDPNRLLSRWCKPPFGDLPLQLKALRSGLGNYRAVRSLCQSLKAPVSMPAVSLFQPFGDDRLQTFIKPRDAALLQAARLAGCALLPVFVTGPAITDDHSRNRRLIETVAGSCEPQEVSAWQDPIVRKNALPQQRVALKTCTGWLTDTAAHIDRHCFEKAAAKLDFLVCAGILHTDMRRHDEAGICEELGLHSVEALRRMREINGSPHELVDRFAAGHARLVKRTSRLDSAGMFDREGPDGRLPRMVAALGQAVTWSHEASEISSRWLNAPAQATLQWLACNRQASVPAPLKPVALAITERPQNALRGVGLSR